MEHPLTRGRSRHISNAAIARRASQDRKAPKHNNDVPVQLILAPIPLTPARPTFIPSPSTSPPSLTSSASLSPDYYDSPPSPPRSLEDQVHVAYALDDIHLAKVLLLRLKGIHVTDNDDPRIAQVKDEDFDFCFVPYGRLMDDDEENTLKELQKRESDRVEEARRTQRLKDCERIWEQGKQRLRELKTLATRKRDLDQKQRVIPATENIRAIPPTPRRTSRPPPTRTVVSYRLAVPSSPPSDPEPFVYDFMPIPRTSPRTSPTKPVSPQSKSQTKTKSTSPFSRPLFDDARAVPFSDVLASMQGPLFPPEERPPSALSPARKRKGAELLESLLAVTVNEDEERKQRKGKAPVRPTPRRRDSTSTIASLHQCAACSSSPSSASSTSSSTSTSSRRSWLSFSSASSSSLSTAATTPSSSPPTSSFAYKHAPTSPLRSLFTPRSTLARPAPTPIVVPRCSCGPHLTPVHPSEAPLPVLPDVPLVSSRSYGTTQQADHVEVRRSNGNVLGRLAHLLDLARNFQSAYMRAALFAVSAAGDTLDERDREMLVRLRVSASSSSPSHSSSNITKGRFRTSHPPGARALPSDVRAFLSLSPSSPPPSPSSSHIPLTQLDAAFLESTFPPPRRTVLPSPLPYKTHFKVPPVPPRSPFRAVHGPALAERERGEKGAQVVLRLRNVESPVWLRVRALENSARGLPTGVVGIGAGYGGYVFGVGSGKGGKMGVWGAAGVFGGGGGGMGRPTPREGALGCGREKMLRVAYEGIGGSRLRFEWTGEVEQPVVYSYSRGREREREGERGRGWEEGGLGMGMGVRRGRAVVW
ncbi:hypothetical protein DXG01_000990 [Tephrocybe rancida]|nr:hypothetical protein DXG01_000990 [Tephrocybe rancida]